ncbi:MAG: alpha/beta fold hydrolase, partial [Bacteroidetes bacterium]
MDHHTFTYKTSFTLENGQELPGFQLAYSTEGQLNEARDNVIWVCHALTGNAHMTEWWPGLFGPGEVFDTRRYFVICANMLGSCYGSTYALSTDLRTGKPFYHDFPLLSNRDIVGAFDLLREHLQL